MTTSALNDVSTAMKMTTRALSDVNNTWDETTSTLHAVEDLLEAGQDSYVNQTEAGVRLAYVVVLLTALVAGVTGNSLAAAAFLRARRKTASDVLVILIALTNAVYTVIDLPFNISVQTGFWLRSGNDAICKMQFWLTQAITLTSALLMTLTAAVRYRAVAIPMRVDLTPGGILWTYGVLLGSSLAVSAPFAMLYGNDARGYCGMTWGGTVPVVMYAVFFFVLVSLMVAIVALYVLAVRVLRRKNRIFSSSVRDREIPTRSLWTSGSVEVSLRRGEDGNGPMPRRCDDVARRRPRLAWPETSDQDREVVRNDGMEDREGGWRGRSGRKGDREGEVVGRGGRQEGKEREVGGRSGRESDREGEVGNRAGGERDRAGQRILRGEGDKSKDGEGQGEGRGKGERFAPSGARTPKAGILRRRNCVAPEIPATQSGSPPLTRQPSAASPGRHLRGGEGSHVTTAVALPKALGAAWPLTCCPALGPEVPPPTMPRRYQSRPTSAPRAGAESNCKYTPDALTSPSRRGERGEEGEEGEEGVFGAELRQVASEVDRVSRHVQKAFARDRLLYGFDVTAPHTPWLQKSDTGETTRQSPPPALSRDGRSLTVSEVPTSLSPTPARALTGCRPVMEASHVTSSRKSSQGSDSSFPVQGGKGRQPSQSCTANADDAVEVDDNAFESPSLSFQPTPGGNMPQSATDPAVPKVSGRQSPFSIGSPPAPSELAHCDSLHTLNRGSLQSSTTHERKLRNARQHPEHAIGLTETPPVSVTEMHPDSNAYPNLDSYPEMYLHFGTENYAGTSIHRGADIRSLIGTHAVGVHLSTDITPSTNIPCTTSVHPVTDQTDTSFPCPREELQDQNSTIVPCLREDSQEQAGTTSPCIEETFRKENAFAPQTAEATVGSLASPPRHAQSWGQGSPPGGPVRMRGDATLRPDVPALDVTRFPGEVDHEGQEKWTSTERAPSGTPHTPPTTTPAELLLAGNYPHLSTHASFSPPPRRSHVTANRSSDVPCGEDTGAWTPDEFPQCICAPNLSPRSPSAAFPDGGQESIPDPDRVARLDPDASSPPPSPPPPRRISAGDLPCRPNEDPLHRLHAQLSLRSEYRAGEVSSSENRRGSTTEVARPELSAEGETKDDAGVSLASRPAGWQEPVSWTQARGLTSRGQGAECLYRVGEEGNPLAKSRWQVEQYPVLEATSVTLCSVPSPDDDAPPFPPSPQGDEREQNDAASRGKNGSDVTRKEPSAANGRKATDLGSGGNRGLRAESPSGPASSSRSEVTFSLRLDAPSALRRGRDDVIDSRTSSRPAPPSLAWRRQEQERRLTVMFVAVSAVFVLCWMPPLAIYITYTVCPFCVSRFSPLHHLMLFGRRFHVIGHVSDPFIYACFSKSFRDNLRGLWNSLAARCRRRV